jgi:mannose-1-phosphate guanylyltransferase
MIQVTPVILCGGSGTRLWPLSRTGFPKQFLCLTGNESLFQQAAQRLDALGSDSIQDAASIIVKGENYYFFIREPLSCGHCPPTNAAHVTSNFHLKNNWFLYSSSVASNCN